jgi:DNA-binding beta-propeller fold protein YncE
VQSGDHGATFSRREALAAGGAGAAALLLGPLADGAEAAGPFALATADKESHVAVVSTGSGRVVRRIRTLEGPRSIQAAPGGVAIVANTSAHAITIVDARARKVRRVLRGFDEPRYTAVTPNGRWAFVTDSGSGDIVVIDLRRARIVARTFAGAHARHVTIDRTGRRLWVGLGSSAERLSVIDVGDPLRPRRLGLVRPPFLAHDVGFSPTGRFVWVTAGREKRIAIFASGGGRPLVQLAADEAPQHVSFGPTLAYVASGEGRSLRVHRLSDGRVVRRTAVPLGSYNVQRGLGRVLTPSLATGALTVLDRRGRVLRSTDIGVAAHDACVVT